MRILTIREIRAISAAIQNWLISRDEAPTEIQEAANDYNGDVVPLSEDELIDLIDDWISAEAAVVYTELPVTLEPLPLE